MYGEVTGDLFFRRSRVYGEDRRYVYVSSLLCTVYFSFAFMSLRCCSFFRVPLCFLFFCCFPFFFFLRSLFVLFVVNFLFSSCSSMFPFSSLHVLLLTRY